LMCAEAVVRTDKGLISSIFVGWNTIPLSEAKIVGT
jgi:hypothetical protein